MSFSNISKYQADAYELIGNALGAVATEVKSSVAKISTAFGNANIALDKIKSNPGQFGKLLLLGSYSVELLKATALKPAATAFGVGAMFFDVFAAGETVDYVVSNVFKKVFTNNTFFNAKNRGTDLCTQASFGVTNLGEAALWIKDKNLINLSFNTVQMINSMTVAALVGYVVLTVNTINKLEYTNYTGLDNASIEKANREWKSDVCSLVWTVSEVALIAIPLAGFAPATSVILAGRIVAKSAAIASFLYKN